MTKSTGIRDEQARQTRAALVAAGRFLFGTRGYFATGTPEIVAAAGVTRGALLHHFPRKRDLFRAVFVDIEEELLRRGAAPASGTDKDNAWTRLRSDMKNFLRAAAATQELQRVLLLDGPVVLGWTEWRRLEAHYGLGRIIQAVEAGMQAGAIRRQAPAPLAHLILSMINEAALFVANAEQPDSVIAEAATAMDTLLSNLA